MVELFDSKIKSSWIIGLPIKLFNAPMQVKFIRAQVLGGQPVQRSFWNVSMSTDPNSMSATQIRLAEMCCELNKYEVCAARLLPRSRPPHLSSPSSPTASW